VRLDVSQPALERERSATVTIYPFATSDLIDVINGVETTGVDFSPYMVSGSMSAAEARFTFTWDGTGVFLANQPKANDIVRIEELGEPLFIGFVENVTTYQEQRGTRVYEIACRTREAMGPWKAKRITTIRFDEGTALTAVAETIIKQQGLEPSEYIVPLGGQTVPHKNVQFTDVTPWEALTEIGLAIGRQPICDAISRIKFVSRDVDRPADFVIGNEQLISINGGRGIPQLTEFRLKWLDRNLTEVVQEEQVLGSTSITAGFWKGSQTEDVYWSEDRRQRAKNTRMKVKQSVNSGLLPIGSESYAQIDEFHGTVTVNVSIFVSGLATASLAAVLALDVLPDGVQVGITGTGITIPKGRVVRGFAEASLLLILMSVGTGQYEILGEPYDFVHARNTTTAYNDASPYWSEQYQDEENDLIYDEAHAQEVCVRELLYRTAEANLWNITMIDDWRIEIGDILELSDSSRLYVTGYDRDLTRGSANILNVQGFRV
jgi:hypothetical protein